MCGIVTEYSLITIPMFILILRLLLDLCLGAVNACSGNFTLAVLTFLQENRGMENDKNLLPLRTLYIRLSIIFSGDIHAKN
jgi:hypothetical protein